MLTRMTILLRTAGAAALLAAGLVPAACRHGPEATPSDGRTAIPLDAEQRAAVLGEMRTMLGSVDAIVNALVRGDTAAVRAAAARSGTAAAADAALEAILPPEWKEIAERTHGGFDGIVASVGRWPLKEDSVLTRLGRITPECVRCHATYRLP
jgi:cytochrome c556